MAYIVKFHQTGQQWLHHVLWRCSGMHGVVGHLPLEDGHDCKHGSNYWGHSSNDKTGQPAAPQIPKGIHTTRSTDVGYHLRKAQGWGEL